MSVNECDRKAGDILAMFSWMGFGKPPVLAAVVRIHPDRFDAVRRYFASRVRDAELRRTAEGADWWPSVITGMSVIGDDTVPLGAYRFYDREGALLWTEWVRDGLTDGA
jgi:hypothetical protein